MKKYKYLAIVSLLAGSLAMTSCGDSFLSDYSTEKQEVGAPATEGAIKANLASAYQILLFDSYADRNYDPVLLMSDLRSDDIYKGGGDAGDQAQLYKLSQFTSTGSETIAGLWKIYFAGLARSNNAIISCNNAVGVDAQRLEQYKAEAHFLRAYYVHLLWKFWGNIPYFEEPITNSPYMTKQLKADEIYAKIMADIDFAVAKDRLPMKSVEKNIGRVSKAAVLMLKARVVLYQKDQSRYAEVTKDMAEVIKSGEYQLMKNFAEIWTEENEFCDESIFESNQLADGRDWINAWTGYGTNLPAFISPNDLKDPKKIFKGGWGFGPVRKAAYDMYEEGDSRREGSINAWPEGSYSPRFQDTGLFQAKYGARIGYNDSPANNDINYSNNLRIFRYAEALLNYAEMVAIHKQAETGGVTAQDCLNQIRKRAFGANKFLIPTAENVKLERRREFLGEGMRFWDLVRWGDATQVLTENDTEHNSTRTFEEWKKYIPIPQSEIDKTKGTAFELVQNGQWK